MVQDIKNRSIRVKSGIFGQTAKFGQPPCFYENSIILFLCIFETSVHIEYAWCQSLFVYVHICEKAKCVVVYLQQSLLFSLCVGCVKAYVNLLVKLLVGAFAVLLCHKC